MRKRAAAILLALCMALTLLPTAAFATEEGGAAAPVEQPTQQEEKQEGQQEQPEETPEQPEEQPEAKPAEQPEQQQESAAQGGPAVQSNETGIALLADEHKHCICGGSVTAGDHTSHSDVAYQPWNGTDGISYTNNTAYVYLTGNATIGGHLTVDGKTLYLCLNGKTLSSNNTAKIQVENGGRLVLCDCQGGGTFKGATQSVWGGACIYLYTSTLDMFGGKLTGGKVTGKGGGGAIALDDQQCIFNMYGGEISGNNGKNYGGAIFRKFNANMPNTTGGTFNMYGGTIKNNTAKNGGAFFSTTGGTINMTGGTISGNTATMNSNDAGGGAIYMRGNGKINISGSAQITGNSSSLDGGAILMGWGEINISGSAKINSNTASRWGGAICLRQDSNQSTMLCMRGGEISGNRANSEGGAVHVFDKDCQFFLYDGKITGNTSGDGGAIYLNQEPSWLIMQGGEISGNTATGNGGGVYIYRTGSVCQLYGGKIENNKASGNGGGIYINPSNSGQLRVGNKPLVQNNTVSGKANNVYLPSDKTLTIEIDMSKGASVGVTTANIRYPVAFSNSYKKDYANYFFADDANAYVEYKDDQRLYLVSDAPLVTYDVTVETEGGGTASASPETAVAGTEITLTAVPAPGYAFDHWEVVKGDVTITDNRFLMPAGAVTVKAVFTAKTFTVYYDPGDGSTPQSRSLGWNDYVLAGVSDPTRPGYTFLNWMYGSRPVADNDTYSGLVQSDAVASATLTAAWQLIPYTITYDLDGGTADGNPTGYSVESAAITLVNPTREGYDFTGWSGTGLTGADNLTVVIPAGSTGDRSYTAHWAKQHVHVFDQQMILPQALKTPADCTHDAVYYLSCVCGLVSTDDNQVFTAVGTALGHDWGQPRWQWTGFAAQAVFACSRDAGHVETLTADVASEVTTAPGCVTDGVRTYTATVTLEGRTYTDTKTESIPATGHDTALKNARAATCTEDGYTGDEVCRTCGETVKQGTAIPATGHDTALKNARAATCTEDGYTGDEVCRTCGETVKQGTVIPATGHDTELKNARAATCTEDGYTGDEVCRTCGETVKQGTVIPATGHDTELKNARAATCTEDGYTGDEVCRTCGETVKQGAVIPATGHDTELKNARAATCTEDGYTGDEVCRTCGETIRQGTVIPATGHDFQDGKCVNCGAADPDYRPAKPENPGVKTGDAGVLLYAGLMLLTLTGSAWVLGRKRTR